MADIVRRDYTARDFDIFQEKLQNYIRARFPDASNDFFENHILTVVTELISYAGDNLAFFLDMTHNEVLWDTVGQRGNIIALAQLLGYYPRGVSSAQVALACTTSAYTGTLSIAKGTKITVGEVVFEVAQNYALNSPTAFSVDIIQGETKTDSFYSDGSSSQLFFSQYTKVSSSVAPIVRVDGAVWTPVNFLWEKDAGNYYEVYYTGEERIRVLFGDGVHGAVPPDTALVTLEYLTSEGAAGNFPVGSIVGTFSGTVSSVAQTINYVNNEASSGGAAAESVEEIRINAPIAFQSLGVVTTAKDLKGFFEKEPGIFKAAVEVDSNTKIVTVYLVASGYTAPSQAQIDAAVADVEEVLVIGAILRVEPAEFPTVDLVGRVFIKSNYSVDEVQDTLNSALTEFFTPEDPASSTKTVGSFVYFSDIIRLLDEVDGVEYVELDRLARTPLPSYRVWETNSGELVLLDIGVNSREEVWTLTFTSAVDFDVVGSVSGVQSPGVVGTPYHSDSGRASFTVQSGTAPNRVGDFAEIRTSPYIGSVQMYGSEFALKGLVDLTYRYVSE